MLGKLFNSAHLVPILTLFGVLSIADFSCALLQTKQQTNTLSRIEFSEMHMGMPVRIVLYAENDTRASRAGRAAYATIARDEDIFSDYRPTSELMRLCRQSGKGPVQVSDALFEVVEVARWLAQNTEGAFDPSAGPLTQLWREARAQNRVPEAESLANALDRVGWQWIHLDPEKKTIELEREGMVLDLGGLAKGYILDRAMEALEEEGIHAALIQAGGEIVVSGAPPGEKGWVIGLAGTSGLKAQRPYTHVAIATSGDTEQYLEHDGVRYSHTIDPRTGWGLTHRYQATVIAKKGIWADGLATAMTLTPVAQSSRLVEAEGLIDYYLYQATD